MSRLRYIVDMPRGPRGGHNDTRHIYTWVESAKRALNTGTRGVQKPEPKGCVLQLDLDDLLAVHPVLDHDAVLQWHDRRALHHTSEMMRMRECEQGGLPQAKWLTTEDLAQIREAVSEWDLEEDRLRRGGGATPAARGAFFVLRDLLRAGKLGRP